MKYHVSIPIKGTSTFSVTADSKEAAIAAAWDKVDAGKRGDVTWDYFEDRRTGDEVEVVPQEKRPTPSLPTKGKE